MFYCFSVKWILLSSVYGLSARIPPPGYAPPSLPPPPPVPAVGDPELPTFPCTCVLPDGTACTCVGSDARRLSTHICRNLTPIQLRMPGRPLPICVLTVLVLFQRYPASTLHWLVVIVANLGAHPRLARSIRHHRWSAQLVLPCLSPCHHFLNAYDPTSALRCSHRPRTRICTAKEVYA